MSRDSKALRVVVASPSDVKAERDIVPEVVNEVNAGVADERGLVLVVTRWEADAFPSFHKAGPQALIDPILRIQDCDIFIGIFGARFGTPLADARSGTEHEYRQAYEAWKQKGSPHILCYFNESPHTPRTKEEARQMELVLELKETFPKEGLWWPYKGKAEFRLLLRRHLEALLRREFPLGRAGTWSLAAPELPAQTLTARLDLLVWRDAERSYVAMPDACIEPLREGMRVRVRATVSPKAYLYLIWLGPTEEPASKKYEEATGPRTAQGASGLYASGSKRTTRTTLFTAYPLYPWVGLDWMELPDEENLVAELVLPDPTHGDSWPMEGTPGLEILVLLVRREPLTKVLRDQMKRHFAEIVRLLAPRAVQFPQMLTRVRLPEEPPFALSPAPFGTTRIPRFEQQQINSDASYLVSHELHDRFTADFDLIRAVCVSNAGKAKDK